MTEASGLDFVHDAGRFGDFEMPSIMAGGGALADFDGDGLLDLFLANGGIGSADAVPVLYRQVDESADEWKSRFVDVSRQTGIASPEPGMGAWWADFDADGFQDLFVTNFGANRLFHNLGDGTFQELNFAPDVSRYGWSTAACWADFNNDGFLDLFVADYVDYVPGQYCEDSRGLKDFCGPSAYAATPDHLLINSGAFADGEGAPFVDESVARGISGGHGKGLGAVACDFNADGRTDVYVANDMQANRLWIQHADGTFSDEAVAAGVAYNFLGEMEASMGVVTGDWNADGFPDLFMAHLRGETNTLYLSTDGSNFRDATAETKLGPPSLQATGFGIGAFDFEHDGDVDFAIGNGRVKRPEGEMNKPGEEYSEPNLIFLRDDGAATYSNRSPLGGPTFLSAEITRSIMAGDIDRDGDVDLVATNCRGPARLFENVSPKRGKSLTLHLVDTRGNRDAVGARVRVKAAKTSLERYVNPYQGYLGQNDPRVHFGLGSLRTFDVEITWHDGERDTIPKAHALPPRAIVVRGRSPGEPPLVVAESP